MRRYVAIVIALASVGLVATSIEARRQAPSASPMAAVGADSPIFTGLHFRLVGPSRGGRSTTVTGVPSEPKTFYMGVASGGVFKTIDGGATWTPMTDGQVPLGSTGSIAVADSNPNVVYLGTGSDAVRSNVSTGHGIYKSTDAGKTWSYVGLYAIGQVGNVRIHPTDPNTVWIAAQGDAFKPSADRGIYKTSDGGKTWRKTLFVADNVGAMHVELQPGNPNTVYAWCSHLQRKPWTIESGGREGGFYKSTDGGEHFTKITAGLPSELIGKGNIGVSAADPKRVYVFVEAKPGSGIYRSDDAGQTFAFVTSQPPAMAAQMIYRPFYYDDARGRSDERGRALHRRRGLLEVDRRRENLCDDARAAWRQPRHLGQPDERPDHDPGQRRRGRRLDRRGPDVVHAEQPADRGDLPASGPTTSFRTSSTAHSRTATRSSSRATPIRSP